MRMHTYPRRGSSNSRSEVAQKTMSEFHCESNIVLAGTMVTSGPAADFGKDRHSFRWELQQGCPDVHDVALASTLGPHVGFVVTLVAAVYYMYMHEYCVKMHMSLIAYRYVD